MPQDQLPESRGNQPKMISRGFPNQAGLQTRLQPETSLSTDSFPANLLIHSKTCADHVATQAVSAHPHAAAQPFSNAGSRPAWWVTT